MDEMDGYEFFDYIKNNKQFQDIPFIFITAKSEASEKMNALKKGAIDFLYKPFHVDELILKNEPDYIDLRNKMNLPLKK